MSQSAGSQDQARRPPPQSEVPAAGQGGGTGRIGPKKGGGGRPRPNKGLLDGSQRKPAPHSAPQLKNKQVPAQRLLTRPVEQPSEVHPAQAGNPDQTGKSGSAGRHQQPNVGARPSDGHIQGVGSGNTAKSSGKINYSEGGGYIYAKSHPNSQTSDEPQGPSYILGGGGGPSETNNGGSPNWYNSYGTGQPGAGTSDQGNHGNSYDVYNRLDLPSGTSSYGTGYTGDRPSDQGKHGNAYPYDEYNRLALPPGGNYQQNGYGKQQYENPYYSYVDPSSFNNNNEFDYDYNSQDSGTITLPRCCMLSYCFMTVVVCCFIICVHFSCFPIHMLHSITLSFPVFYLWYAILFISLRDQLNNIAGEGRVIWSNFLFLQQDYIPHLT